MAREKKVFGNKSEVAHAWAKQDQYEGREGSRVLRIFFEGPTIFSYGRHFPIATFHQKKGQPKVVLFTTRTYSNTTSAHIWAARGASSHFPHIYCQSPTDAASGRHDDNMKNWESEAANVAINLAKAKKPEKYLSAIASLRREMEAYAAYFKCGVKKYKFRFLMIENQETGKKLTVKERAEEAARNKLAKERQAVREAEDAKRNAARVEREIAEFRAGERDYVNGSEFTLLRFQNGQIETSKRVNIEFEEAKRYYDRLKSLQFRFSNQGMLSTNDQGSEFQGYALRTVTREYFEIGCHKILYSELDSVAKAAGFSAFPYTMKEEG